MFHLLFVVNIRILMHGALVNQLTSPVHQEPVSLRFLPSFLFERLRGKDHCSGAFLLVQASRMVFMNVEILTVKNKKIRLVSDRNGFDSLFQSLEFCLCILAASGQIRKVQKDPFAVGRTFLAILVRF